MDRRASKITRFVRPFFFHNSFKRIDCGMCQTDSKHTLAKGQFVTSSACEKRIGAWRDDPTSPKLRSKHSGSLATRSLQLLILLEQGHILLILVVRSHSTSERPTKSGPRHRRSDLLRDHRAAMQAPPSPRSIASSQWRHGCVRVAIPTSIAVSDPCQPSGWENKSHRSRHGGSRNDFVLVAIPYVSDASSRK